MRKYLLVDTNNKYSITVFNVNLCVFLPLFTMKLLLVTMSIRFTTEEGDVTIPKIWATRWQTLVDLLVDFPEQDTVGVPYTYTSKKELEQWEMLNCDMDQDYDKVVWNAS